jgi:hypothetical protein
MQLMGRLCRQASIGVLVALSIGLTLSACGGSSTQVQSSAETTSPIQVSSEVPAESTTTTPTTTQSLTASTPGPETTSPEPVNNFPEASVVAVDSGEPFNLRMLGGTGTPVALWFYYPH